MLYWNIFGLLICLLCLGLRIHDYVAGNLCRKHAIWNWVFILIYFGLASFLACEIAQEVCRG